MTPFLSGLRFFACMTAVIAVIAAVPVAAIADEPVPQGPFATAVLRRLEKVPQYIELTSLYKKQLRQDKGTRAPSPRTRRLLALLTRVRAQAASATTIDPEDPDGSLIANYKDSAGRVVRLPNVVPSQIDANPAVRDDVAGMVARIIMDEAVSDGFIPFDPPPVMRESAAKEMQRGYAAACRKDYPGAIHHFEQARALTPTSPEIYYNLGLAESKIPGRELRALVWFGAYLAIDPGASNAAAVRKQIADLETAGVSRFIRITGEVAGEIPSSSLREFYLIDLVDLWARIGDYSAARETLNKIQGAYNADTAIEKMVVARARQRDFQEALHTAASISNLGINGSALRSVAREQAIAGDMKGALKIVSGIQDHFSKSTGYWWLASIRIKEGDTAGALELLETALKFTAGITDAYFRDLARQYIATTQAQAGDAAAAFRTVAGIVDPFQSALARLYIAEWQACSGDLTAARQTLADGLRSIDSIREGPRSIAQGTYQEVKGRIDAGSAGKRDEQPAAALTPSVTPRSWIMKNEGLLNDRVFLDLNGYLMTLPAGNTGLITNALKETARKMIAAHDEIVAMVDELDRRDPRSSSSESGDSTEEEGVVAGSTESAVTAKSSDAREYSYQGRQIALSPEQVFDITGRIARAEVTMSDFGAGSEFGVSLVLRDNAQQAFKDFTERNSGKEAGLLYQARLVLVAVMRDPVTSGVIQIRGGFRTIKEARKLAAEFNGE